MSQLPERPPDWRTRAAARLRRAVVRPLAPGAKSHQGEPGQPGRPGEPGTAGGGTGGTGGTGGEGGRGGAAPSVTITSGARRAAVFLFCFSLTLAAGNLLFTAREVDGTRAAITASTRAAASVAQLCQLGNEARIQQIVLWERIITISRPPPHETPAQERRRLATVRAFDAYLHRLFAPRDCRALHH